MARRPMLLLPLLPALTALGSPGGQLVAAPCFSLQGGHYEPLITRQQWSFDYQQGGPIRQGKQCLTASEPNRRGSPLTMAPCKPGSPGQDWAPISNLTSGSLALKKGSKVGLQNGGLTNSVLWLGPGTSASFNSTQMSFTLAPRAGFNHAVGCGRGCTLCMTSGGPVRPCDQPSPAAGFPMCDASLPLAQRVRDLVQRIPAEDTEKLLVNVAGPVPSLWIQSQNWWSEALHGVQSSCANGASGRRCPVSFPAAISTAASYNSSLFHAVGDAVGTEARALSNIGAADGFTFWSPNINIARDPRWGRGQETPGEGSDLQLGS